MSAQDIQSRVALGRARAVAATGTAGSNKPIYVIKKTKSNDLINPTVTETKTLLVDAIFQSFEKGLIDSEVQTGDRILISQHDIEINQGDLIEQGSDKYVVQQVDEVRPVSDTLIFKSRVRLQ